MSILVEIAAGSSFSLAVKSDGTLWAWGHNWEGQLGNGTTDRNAHPTPKQIANFTSATMVCAGDNYGMAAKSNGRVWAWGYIEEQFNYDTNNSASAPKASLFSFSTLDAVARPTLSPDGGAYVSAQKVTVNCSTTGATIYYTTDGDDPTTSDSVITSGSKISIAKGTTRLKVRAFKTSLTGFNASPLKLALYQAGEKAATGYSHSLGIKSDSSLWAWGNNSEGQLGNESTASSSYPLKVSGITKAIDAAGGGAHTVALKNDRTVWAWGRNSEGQLGNGTLDQQTSPVKVGGLSNVINVGAGYDHSFAIKSDGSLWAWGQNNYGQLGNGNTSNSAAATKVSNLSGVIDATGGYGFSLALKSDGTVWGWGDNGYGQLGDGSNIQRNIPVQVSPLNNVVAISAGRSHSMALKGDGTVWAWGNNGYGQLGKGHRYISDEGIPVQVTVLTNVVAIAAGEYHSLALKNDGTLWAWGHNGQGQLGNGTGDGYSHPTPIQIANFTSATMVYAGGIHGMAAKSNGSVWVWGNNRGGQFGDGTNNSASTPKASLFTFSTLDAVARPTLSPDGGAYVTAQKVTVSCSTTGATIHYTTNGADPTTSDPVIASGSKISIAKGITRLKVQAFKTSLTSLSAGPVKLAIYQVGEKAITGYSHSLAIKSDSSLWVWGNNDEGQLGNGSTANSSYPLRVSGITKAIDAAGGYAHTVVALKNDGTVWAWGRNSEGQLGNGTLDQQLSPVQVSGLSNVINVGAAYYHSFAIKSDGSLWAWGQNNYGQLGNGNTSNSAAAKKVSNLSKVIDATGGDGFSLALKSDGTVWAWGDNGDGQLGDRSGIQRNIPEQVWGLNNVVAISAGRHHSMALKGDGTVWAWGNGRNGQLGNGSIFNEGIPVQVTELTNVVAIAAGEYHSLALKDDGTLWSWGYNGQGQLGNPSYDNQNTPVPVLKLNHVTSINACTQTLTVTLATGSNFYWAFGKNNNGQLGDETLIDKFIRVLVHFPIDKNANEIPDWMDYSIFLTADTDRDGLLDSDETTVYGTDPKKFDMNQDGLADGVNVFTGLAVKGKDTDGDGISNVQELINGTSPILADTDGDGVSDKSDAFPSDRYRTKLPPPNSADHTYPTIILKEPF